MQQLHIKPISNHERSLAPDLARGFMLLIIAIAHAPLWLSVTNTNLLSRPEGGSTVGEIINFFCILFVDNRGMPLFAALFGYGMTMMVKRQLSAGMLETESKRLLKRRSLFLLLFGLVHTVIIGGIDILAFYGTAGLLIGWLLFRGDQTLRRGILLVSLFSIIFILFVWTGISIDMNGYGVSAGFSDTSSYGEAALTKLIGFPFMILAQLFMYPMLLPVLIGMWAARNDLLNGKKHRKLLILIAITGIAISIIGALPFAMISTKLWIPSPATIGLMTSLQILTGLAGGFGYAVLFGLIGSFVNRTGFVTYSLAALGKRSLTFYLFNEAMLVIIMSPVAFGLGHVLHTTGAFVTAVLIWFTSLFLATILERKGLRGPADAFMRRLVYKN
ncbi:DUF418 domain-containing protein [Bacillus manliponensis]|uniref:DUF418 domain-containing protein n=1 Tax=Bacillus manliponensis TaxID=574376 RepID=UPI00068AFD9F|nr:DUF418 domain-containing protein [Bacillus manliponensis]